MVAAQAPRSYRLSGHPPGPPRQPPVSSNRPKITAAALGIVKRLLDYNQRAPAIYLPLLVPECFRDEPTETKEILGDFINAMAATIEEANTNPEAVTKVPFTRPCAAWMR